MSAREFLANTSALAVGIPLTLLLVIGGARPQSDKLAAVFPPWWPPARAFAAAAGAGRVVAIGGVPGMIVVHGDAADLADRLRDAGAFFLIDSRFSAGCQAAAPEIAR